MQRFSLVFLRFSYALLRGALALQMGGCGGGFPAVKGERGWLAGYVCRLARRFINNVQLAAARFPLVRLSFPFAHVPFPVRILCVSARTPSTSARCFSAFCRCAFCLPRAGFPVFRKRFRACFASGLRWRVAGRADCSPLCRTLQVGMGTSTTDEGLRMVRRCVKRENGKSANGWGQDTGGIPVF